MVWSVNFQRLQLRCRPVIYRYCMSRISEILIPPDEDERLLSLHKYDVLPTLQEPVFDELVALTARIFSLPISLIALVDAETVHYTSNQGMPGNVSQPREEALCSTAILHHKAVVYQDIAAETADIVVPPAAQAAEANELRFYAAAALTTPDEHRVGSLCVIDHQPRTFSDHEKSVLEQLAVLASQTIAVRHGTLRKSKGSKQHWLAIHTQLQEEVQALTALVRYLFTRHGIQVPVSPDVLTQVERRLLDLHDVLNETEK